MPLSPPVVSVNGYTGAVALTAADVGAVSQEALDEVADVAQQAAVDLSFYVADNNAAMSLKQPLDSDLTAIAGLTPSDDDILQRKSGAWANRTLTQVKVDLEIDQVDNTSDLDKPISTAVQDALDEKTGLVDAVLLTGIQTVAGQKTFTSPLIAASSFNALSATITNGVTAASFTLAAGAGLFQGTWLSYADGTNVAYYIRDLAEPKAYLTILKAAGAGAGTATFNCGLTALGTNNVLGPATANVRIGPLDASGIWIDANSSSNTNVAVNIRPKGTGKVDIWGGLHVRDALTAATTLAVAGNVGFYGTSPVAKPTGVGVTAADIHAALVTLGLIAA